ncbi:hypothetical protein GDO81_018635 [Engystomops pustulosus]|uniref:Uncharacterized protein n=1 Tax=Engystomops pustulosus TaxID=76066 RepID=A0AAV6YIE3_ENGPU|nr:hypothetical protein GDO81_018635 [Engystomops pustulosus]
MGCSTSCSLLVQWLLIPACYLLGLQNPIDTMFHLQPLMFLSLFPLFVGIEGEIWQLLCNCMSSTIQTNIHNYKKHCIPVTFLCLYYCQMSWPKYRFKDSRI